MRYYYKQNETENYFNLKSPLSDVTGYTEITEEEFNAAQEAKKHIPTEEELVKRTKLKEINQLKYELAKTDYMAIKFAEGWISSKEYAEIKALRQSYRDRINELESTL